jgi:hypothetical protein
MPVNDKSILEDTKKALGLAEDYTPFDQEIVLHINSVFGDLTQLGIGPPTGFEIEDSEAKWVDYLGTDARFNGVKSYMYHRVRLLWDPPQLGYVLDSIKEQIEKAEWRLNVAREERDYPDPKPDPLPDDAPVVVTPEAPGYDEVTHTLTIPNVTGVQYSITGIIVNGQFQINATTVVHAAPLPGYKFPPGTEDYFVLTYV